MSEFTSLKLKKRIDTEPEKEGKKMFSNTFFYRSLQLKQHIQKNANWKFQFHFSFVLDSMLFFCPPRSCFFIICGFRRLLAAATAVVDSQALQIINRMEREISHRRHLITLQKIRKRKKTVFREQFSSSAGLMIRKMICNYPTSSVRIKTSFNIIIIIHSFIPCIM